MGRNTERYTQLVEEISKHEKKIKKICIRLLTSGLDCGSFFLSLQIFLNKQENSKQAKRFGALSWMVFIKARIFIEARQDFSRSQWPRDLRH
jgi:hypothetical protein